MGGTTGAGSSRVITVALIKKSRLPIVCDVSIARRTAFANYFPDLLPADWTDIVFGHGFHLECLHVFPTFNFTSEIFAGDISVEGSFLIQRIPSLNPTL